MNCKIYQIHPPLGGEPAYEPVHPHQPAYEPDNRPVDGSVDEALYLPFTPKQGAILLHLIKAGGIGNREKIATEIGATLSTVKHTLILAAQRGYILAQRTYCYGGQRGFMAELDQALCGEYIGRFLSTSDRPVDRPVHPSSSLLKTLKTKNLTTGQNRPKPVYQGRAQADDPEVAYWKEKGVTTKQINSWGEEFQMPVEQVIQSLKYCRYEMVVLNQEVEKQISNPMNWFYKIMLRSGVYPKPANYKSLVEIRAEQMEQAAKEAAEARERQIAAEQELAFQKIMEDPEGEEYQALLIQVTDFAREMGGMALDAAMRDIFNGETLQFLPSSVSPGRILPGRISRFHCPA
jgi:hypothetical protein